MSENNKNYFVHESAYVDEGANIGANTKIWHFCHVLPGAQIGENCNLGQNVVVHGTAVVGNGVKIQNNVSVYDGVILGDFVFCGPSMVFTNVYNPRSEVNRKNEYMKTVVEKGVTIGANATIVCGTTIGEYAFIGAGTVVLDDVPSHSLMVGNPAVQKGWMCKCGIRIEPIKEHLTCHACQQVYSFTPKGLKAEEI